ncbi:MAG: hypothetical protein GY871_04365 [Actinomycetales bacterium]|nr:hypothetical protein [Actinomycetales bacterium]
MTWRRGKGPGMRRHDFWEVSELADQMLEFHPWQPPPGWRLEWEWIESNKKKGVLACGQVFLKGPDEESQILWRLGPKGDRRRGKGWAIKEARWTLDTAEREFNKLQRAAQRRREQEKLEAKYDAR